LSSGAAEAQVHFLSSRLAKQSDDDAASRSAYEGIVDHHDSLACDDLGHRVELEPDHQLALILGRQDEAAAGVMAPR
jgi:hypothetical protein